MYHPGCSLLRRSVAILGLALLLAAPPPAPAGGVLPDLPEQKDPTRKDKRKARQAYKRAQKYFGRELLYDFAEPESEPEVTPAVSLSGDGLTLGATWRWGGSF